MEKVNLQLKTGGVPNVLHLSQYDTNRSYLFTPYYGSEAYAYQSGAVVYVEATKPDKTVVAAEATYNTDGTVTYALSEALTQVAGDVRAKITWVKDKLRLASAEVIFACDAAGIDTYARISESDLEALHTAEAKMQDIEASVAKAQTSESNAAKSASAAKTSETNAAASKTAAAASASAAKTSETNAASSKTAAASSASAAKTSETNAASSKTAAASSASAAKTSETNAASSKTAAATSASNAKTSETNAAASATAAAASAKEAASAIAGVASLNSKSGALTLGFDESTGEFYITG